MRADVFCIFVIMDFIKRTVKLGDLLFRNCHCRRYVRVCVPVSGLFPGKGSAAVSEAAVNPGVYSDFNLGNYQSKCRCNPAGPFVPE